MNRLTFGGQPRDVPSMRLEHDAERNQFILAVEDPDTGTSQRAVLPQSVVDALAKDLDALRTREADTGVQAQVTVIEYANLGDSAAFIRKPLTYDPHETVGALLARAHGLGEKWPRPGYDGERVELQVIQETVPKPEPVTWPPGNAF